MYLSRHAACGLAPLAVLLLGTGTAAMSAQTVSGSLEESDVTQVSLEDLLGVEVTSVSKKAQKISEAAAAVYVITRDDIRRSGATSIPEALRMAPGIEVARLNGNTWAISARGFNSRFANKLLVLMDGRSVYSPDNGGVYWEMQDTLLEDIDRIEVIRGPGATLWGANAVNGVINIITRAAKDTQGALAYVGTGSVDRSNAGIRYGGKAGDASQYRGYLKFDNRRGFVDAGGNRTGDDWQSGRGGFRIDSRLGGGDLFTLQGDWYRADQGNTFSNPTFNPPFTQLVPGRGALSGGNVIARWNRILSATSGFTLQVYYDRTRRNDAQVYEAHDTIDVDFQHRFAAGESHDFVWGFAYRSTQDDMIGRDTLQFSQRKRRDTLVSAFVQDEMKLIEDRLRFIWGSKFEHNGYTGMEVQPSLRLMWTPEHAHSLWGALSRAVHTPQRFDFTGRFNEADAPGPFPGAPPTQVAVIGTGLQSEQLTAFELGYRFNPSSRLAADVTAFYNRYRKLRGAQFGDAFFETEPFPPHLVVPMYLRNNAWGTARGLELTAEWLAADWWRWHLSYTRLLPKVETAAGPTNPSGADGASPRRQIYVRSSMNLDRRIELDLWLKFVDRLPGLDIPAYTSFNGRLGWKMNRNVELALAGYNLFDSRHPEFTTDFISSVANQIPRGVYLQATVRY